MHLIAILLFMAVLPLASIAIEALAFPGPPLFALVGKWFVFWGVGLRLITAGLKQVLDPSFTAQRIFKLADPAANRIVVEIGHGNLAMGAIAILSLAFPAWVAAAALAGCLFYLLAGLQHVRNTDRTGPENAALYSDLAMAAVLAIYLAWWGLKAA